MDVAHEAAASTPVAESLAMIEAKIGALIGAALEAGGVIAGASVDVRARLRRAGRLLGVAFQLGDDWLGTWGQVSKLGSRA